MSRVPDKIKPDPAWVLLALAALAFAAAIGLSFAAISLYL